MVIANTNVKSVFNGNGVTREWPIDFVIDTNVSKVSIIVEDKDGVQTEVDTNFAIANNVVTYPTVESGLSPLKDGEKIVIFRTTPHTQEIDLIQQGVLDAEVLESGFDKLTMEVQELSEELSRAIKVPMGEEGSDKYQDPLKAIEQAKEEAIADVEDSTKAAEHAVEKAKEQVELAKEEVSKVSKQLQFAEDISEAAEGFAKQAKQSATNADISAASSFKSANQAITAAEEVKKAAEEIQLPAHSIVIYTVGTPQGKYDGGLNNFPSAEKFVSNSTFALVNGVWQERDLEFFENADKSGITFNYNLQVGDVVWLITTTGFFEKKDIKAFKEAIEQHNTSDTAHPDLRDILLARGWEENFLINLGVFEKTQSMASSKRIKFKHEPIGVSIRFSDLDQKMWITCVDSAAGIEKVGEEEYNVYYSISSDDFCRQQTIIGPFVVQLIIKYVNKELFDERYVNVDGDAMTGSFTMKEGSEGIKFESGTNISYDWTFEILNENLQGIKFKAGGVPYYTNSEQDLRLLTEADFDELFTKITEVAENEENERKKLEQKIKELEVLLPESAEGNLEAIREMLDGYVAKTGDEMSGALKTPTPEATSNDNTVATTSWVRKIISEEFNSRKLELDISKAIKGSVYYQELPTEKTNTYTVPAEGIIDFERNTIPIEVFGKLYLNDAPLELFNDVPDYYAGPYTVVVNKNDVLSVKVPQSYGTTTTFYFIPFK